MEENKFSKELEKNFDKIIKFTDLSHKKIMEKVGLNKSISEEDFLGKELGIEVTPDEIYFLNKECKKFKRYVFSFIFPIFYCIIHTRKIYKLRPFVPFYKSIYCWIGLTFYIVILSKYMDSYMNKNLTQKFENIYIEAIFLKQLKDNKELYDKKKTLVRNQLDLYKLI